MILLLVSFFAGVMTILAPCILPLLPVALSSGVGGRDRRTPFVVILSLSISIIVFTFLLKASSACIAIPPYFWSYLSGSIITLFGLTLIFPQIWDRLPFLSSVSSYSNSLLGTGYQKKNFWGDVIMGASLGPIFTTCSPTYFVILGTVLPSSYILGTLYLVSYVAGLSLTLFLIAFFGQKFIEKIYGLSDPKGVFKRMAGVVFIILGIFIFTGYEKKLQIKILDSGYFDITKIEQNILDRFQIK